MRGVICWIAALYIRFVNMTTRWTVVGPDDFESRLDLDKPVIGVFWHARMMMIPHLWKRFAGRRKMNMLISGHRDGRLIARLIGLLGITTITGSSTRGGTDALRTILRTLQGGESVAFTPDGPRGPRMRASLGPVVAARLSGVPIYTVSYSVRRGRLFDSWDRFLLPLPFGRGVMAVAHAIAVPRDADEAALETYRRSVEAQLNAITRQADELCGRPPVEPAPVHDPGRAGAPRKRRKSR